MTTAPTVARTPATKPRLLFFTSSASGRCRRVEGYLAQVLQRRRNHGTFRVTLVDAAAKPEVAERFGVSELPTIMVVERNEVRARLDEPRGCRDIEELLAPWLR